VSALEAAGVGSDVEVIATLAVAIDRALEPEPLAEARQAVAALDMAGASAKIAGQVKDAWRSWKEHAKDAPRRGLPHGLERISREAPPRAVAPTVAKSDMDALEARIDRELAALKQKLREGG
jgi:hypothetical protein